MPVGDFCMNERDLRDLIGAVKARRVSRRAFVHRMVGLGLTAPFATRLLAHAGLAQTPAQAEYNPTKAGGGGPLKMLFWQAPTLLNPHFAVGTKDQEGSRIFYEPLAAWDSDGNLAPVLAAEIPDIENGGVAPDGMSVTWKLKKDVRWHDGNPFSADDVVFTGDYAGDPATASTTIGNYRDINVEKVDPLTVRVHFAKPTPFWASPFVGQFGMIIPKHLFEPYKGANSREATTNLPRFSDPGVGHELSLLVDRAWVEAHIYGRTGLATGNFVNNPPRFVSKNTKWEFNIEKANQVLDEAGWGRGSDGVRIKDGKKLKLVFQTSINAPRQKTQAIVKQACQKAGIETELKSGTASVYFSSDVANPDTHSKFYVAIQISITTLEEPD